jgi:hypothetical protein
MEAMPAWLMVLKAAWMADRQHILEGVDVGPGGGTDRAVELLGRWLFEPLLNGCV